MIKNFMDAIKKRLILLTFKPLVSIHKPDSATYIEGNVWTKNLPISIKCVLFLYLICFFADALSHCINIFNHGICPYKGLPPILNLYFISLIFFDSLVVMFMFMRPMRALVLANLIMISNLLIDAFYTGLGGTNLSTIFGFELFKDFRFGIFLSTPFVISRLIYKPPAEEESTNVT